METEKKCECVEDREEGEIIEDEFEDVSDCSMSISSPVPSPPHSGKFLSPPEFLRAVSLSSVSDGDVDDGHVVPTYSHYSSKTKRSRSPPINRRRKRRAKYNDSYSFKLRKTKKYHGYNSDSENERLEKKRLLNKALRRENEDEILHNSLRTRLKAMLKKNSSHPSKDDDDEDLESLREIALLSQNKTKDGENDYSLKRHLESDIKNDLNSVIEKDLQNDLDSVIVIDETEDSENNSEQRDNAHNSDTAEITEDMELINLRLEALKSAVLKKSKERKRLKVRQKEPDDLNLSRDNLIIPDDVEEFDEIDKENNHCLVENTSSKLRKCSESEKVLNESNVRSDPTLPIGSNDLNNVLKDPPDTENEQSNKAKQKCGCDLIDSTDKDKGKTDSECEEKSLLDEDVDILRAMLLASMSRKITNKTVNENVSKTQKTIFANSKPTSQVLTKVLPSIRSVTPSVKNYPSLNITVQKSIIRTIANNNNNVPNNTPIESKFVSSKINNLDKKLQLPNSLLINKKKYNSKIHKWSGVQNFEVKPLIINVNGNSDSEEDLDESQTADLKLTETVEQFLKKQRAEVEAKANSNSKTEDSSEQTEPTTKNIKIDLDVKTDLKQIHIESNKESLLKKHNQKFVNALKYNSSSRAGKNIPAVKDDTRSVIDKSLNDFLLNKSSLKLLPKSQQIEYHKLKQQLLLAKKKYKLKRLSKQSIKKDIKVNGFTKRNPKVQNFNNILLKSSKSKPNQIVQNDNKKNSNIQEKALEAVTSLKNVLADMQIQQNGRLQMKGKYQQLVPLLRRVNEASNERRQNEVETKRLLLELQKTRTKLADSLQNFIKLVEQLVSDKEAIDKGISKVKTVEGPVLQKMAIMCTSTPNKNNSKIENSCDISALQNSSKKVNLKEDDQKISAELNEHNKDENLNTKNKENDSSCVDTQENNAEEKDAGVDEKQNSDNSKEININNFLNEIDLVDPNDIEKVFIEQKATEKALSEYISPLGNKESENKTSDPLKEICPYDLFGVCRDKECPYRHCS